MPATADFNGASIEGAGVYDINTPQRPALAFQCRISAPGAEKSQCVDRAPRPCAKAGLCAGWARGRRRGPAGWRQADIFGAARGHPVGRCGRHAENCCSFPGIGDGKALNEKGIESRRHLPAVGENLQDHLAASFYYRANRPTLNGVFASLFGQARLGLQYMLTRKGPFAMSVNQAGGFFRGSPAQARPNIQLYFNPLSYRIPVDASASMVPEPYAGFPDCVQFLPSDQPWPGLRWPPAIRPRLR